VKLRVVHSSARLFRRLRSVDVKLREAAVDAAAEVLKDELQRAGARTISVQPLGARRSVGSPEAVAEKLQAKLPQVSQINA
jgi:hypothetical protein